MTATVAAWRSGVRRAVADTRIALRQPRAPIRPVGPPCGTDAVPPGSSAVPPGVGAAFDPDRAFALLRAQCDSGPRAAGCPARERTRRLILDQLGRCVDELAVQDWRQRVERGAGAGRAYPMTNILGRLRGTGAPPVRTVLLGTHWDTRPVADLDPDPLRRGQPVAGASDGGSGVAVLLELARVLSADRPRPDVLIACWDGEDLGEHFYGSRQFARALRRRAGERWRPDAAVVIDMIGGVGMRCATEADSAAHAPALWAELHAGAADLGLAGRFHGPVRRINDDHVPLRRAGIPSVLLIDPAYPHRHTTGEVPERCDPESLDAIGRVLHHLVAARSPVRR
ncbi:MAG TPA: M28 family peptidase [Pilimelia sp.]|nr:M28 family peptidase [Pilimelia sp.]